MGGSLRDLTDLNSARYRQSCECHQNWKSARMRKARLSRAITFILWWWGSPFSGRWEAMPRENYGLIALLCHIKTENLVLRYRVQIFREGPVKIGIQSSLILQGFRPCDWKFPVKQFLDIPRWSMSFNRNPFWWVLSALTHQFSIIVYQAKLLPHCHQ